MTKKSYHKKQQTKRGDTYEDVIRGEEAIIVALNTEIQRLRNIIEEQQEDIEFYKQFM